MRLELVLSLPHEHQSVPVLIRALVDRVGFSVGVQAGTVVSLEKRLVYAEGD